MFLFCMIILKLFIIHLITKYAIPFLKIVMIEVKLSKKMYEFGFVSLLESFHTVYLRISFCFSIILEIIV